MNDGMDVALPGERQRVIAERLHRDGRVIAADLAVEFRVSEDSIRRDLRDMAAQGLCKRVYGGALLMHDVAPLSVRHKENAGLKRSLAQVAAGLVGKGQIIFLDAGSTNSAIAAALPEHHGLTVVTNAPDVALAVLGRPGFDVLLLGGRVHPKIGGAIGSLTLRQAQGIRADLCFPGICAIDPVHGLWTYDSEEVVLKQAIIEASGETVAVATPDKLIAAATHHTAPIAAIAHLVVAADTDEAVVAAYRAAGVAVYRA
ncbi:DeoR/GlpR family transcriptional regulator of sugar metabolism [Luteibacter sp. Sphag1AF]|uniref:DeoR/GlpR family DNA-binding transcription regulator n=1 Tax=Luteibacter sp. Sphag1AF TaxID=2587031 RepID=UPI00161A201D|nr:DeoR/GlpR family DNA-binding transcription regulator [Luteibacter sp. Sphag1AF]MBB3228475.1 DeoR/GlpR family transcriptional regulator of sugar metabolism [Luteibacter sp. Sphag1AF]